MNTQEREQLTRFLQQLAQASASNKDAEAEALIGEACRRQADASYLLVQRALLLEQALQGAQAEIGRLRGELDKTQGGGRFLDGNAWGSAAAPMQRNSPPPVQPSSVAASPTAPSAGASSWGTGLLGTVATTAAGVVAGSFLYQGIEHLMGNRHGASGFLSGADPSTPNGHTENVLASNHDESVGSDEDYVDPLDGGGNDSSWI